MKATDGLVKWTTARTTAAAAAAAMMIARAFFRMEKRISGKAARNQHQLLVDRIPIYRIVLSEDKEADQ